MMTRGDHRLGGQTANALGRRRIAARKVRIEPGLGKTGADMVFQARKLVEQADIAGKGNGDLLVRLGPLGFRTAQGAAIARPHGDIIIGRPGVENGRLHNGHLPRQDGRARAHLQDLTGRHIQQDVRPVIGRARLERRIPGQVRALLDRRRIRRRRHLLHQRRPQPQSHNHRNHHVSPLSRAGWSRHATQSSPGLRLSRDVHGGWGL